MPFCRGCLRAGLEKQGVSIGNYGWAKGENLEG